MTQKRGADDVVVVVVFVTRNRCMYISYYIPSVFSHVSVHEKC